MRSGLLPDWEPRRGAVTAWRASRSSKDAVRAAATEPAHPSYIQRRHFVDAAGAQTGKRRSSFAVVTFDIHDAYDERLVAEVFRDHLRRHSVYHTWVEHDGGGYTGRTIAAEDIEVEIDPAVGGVMEADALRAYVDGDLPDIAEWDMFRLIAIRPEETPDRFTLAFVVDHFYSDGVSLGIVLYEFVTAYRAARSGEQPRLPGVEGYHAYCADEKDHCDELTWTHDDVQRWAQLLVRAGGHLPRFPLPLGLSEHVHVPGRGHMIESAVDAAALDAFAEVCRGAGGNLNSGVIAVASMLDAVVTGNPVYSMLTPVSTRSRRSQILSVGWYTRLVPVQFARAEDPLDFAAVIAGAQRGVEESRAFARTPLHRVLEVLPSAGGEAPPTDFAAPMISYLDLRSLPGNNLPVTHDMHVYGSVDDSREVFVWLNRTPQGLDVNVIHPDTETAARSTAAYTDAFVAVIASIARHGRVDPLEIAPQLDALRTAAGREAVAA
ncbi:condensation domain-containing protein [Microbacterium betulae]|uniref:Condensation domain-containing protein n=1 Tax=Microbacterium betulae TaxID=2981139 RepID=A0AA97FI64_9MICO|nr:condensation domain-containing protein [Microbacterium sp. AB]WOF23014.1 condensation domain-containing protein [Microbacterium sp. AB]